MSKSKAATLAAVVLAAALTLGVEQAAFAQSAPTSGDAVMWGGDDVELTNDGFSLIGRAEILQGENRLRADRLDLRVAEGDLTQVEAGGHVYFVTPRETIRGDRAVYAVSGGTVTVTGDVILTQGQNVATGSRLTYNIETGAARLEGAPTPGAGNRVQGVFYPERRSN